MTLFEIATTAVWFVVPIYWLIGVLSFAWPLYRRMLARDKEERVMTVCDHLTCILLMPWLWPVFFWDVWDKRRQSGP